MKSNREKILKTLDLINPLKIKIPSKISPLKQLRKSDGKLLPIYSYWNFNSIVAFKRNIKFKEKNNIAKEEQKKYFQ